MSMLPREHGAYGQLAFPLATAFAIAGVTPPALFMALAAIGGFLAHEPLLVLLGRRGLRASRDQRFRATALFAVTGAIGIVSGAAALWLAPSDIRWSFLLPLLPAALLAGALSTNREKSAVGEITAAVAFSFIAIPICLAAGTSLSTAFSVGIAFASLFAGSTLSVRVVILKVRCGGDPQSMRASRLLLLVLTACIAAGLVTAASSAVLPWATLLAIVPGLLVAVGLAFRPPAPTRLRTVGWALVSTSAAAAVILIVALAHSP